MHDTSGENKDWLLAKSQSPAPRARIIATLAAAIRALQGAILKASQTGVVFVLMTRADLREETQQRQSDLLALLTSIVSLRVESV